MQALHSPSNFISTNAVASISTTNPNPNLTTTTTASSSESLAAPPKSLMAADSSSPTVAEAGANKENICPLTGFVANSVVSPKRRRFVRKPLADITNQRNPSNDRFLRGSGCSDAQKKTLKRKADSGNEVEMSCSRSKTLRMSFR